MVKETNKKYSCVVKLLPLMVFGRHAESEVQMQLTLVVFDASLHQDRVTMSGSFCSWFTSILPPNKRVTVCSFATRSLATMLRPSYSRAMLSH